MTAEQVPGDIPCIFPRSRRTWPDGSARRRTRRLLAEHRQAVRLATDPADRPQLPSGKGYSLTPGELTRHARWLHTRGVPVDEILEMIDVPAPRAVK